MNKSTLITIILLAVLVGLLSEDPSSMGQGLLQNRVYVQDEDFDLVLGFLRQHCHNAK